MRAARSSVRGADPSLCPADSAERVVQRFTVPGVSNYTALLLSPDGGTLYLGAREVLFAVNTSHFQPGAPARRVSPRTTEPRGGLGAPSPSLVQVLCKTWCFLQPVGTARRLLPQLCWQRVLSPKRLLPRVGWSQGRTAVLGPSSASPRRGVRGTAGDGGSQ